MLSIVVNDALNGVDIMKKYPAFYARMLADEDLRNSFLDTLELLEMSRAGELPEYEGPETVNLSFLNKLLSKAALTRLAQGKWRVIWQTPVQQLQKLFDGVLLEPKAVYRNDDLYLEDTHTSLLQGLVEIEEREVEVRVDVSKNEAEPDNYNIMFLVIEPDEGLKGLEATISWGSYQQTVRLNSFGLAKFPPIKRTQLFDQSGKLIHDFECCLVVAEQE
jgi:hypothetical protein